MNELEFDWQNGVVSFWDLGEVDADQPLQEQLELLKEDLAQIEFEEGVLLDVGWFPSFSPSGRFIVVVVKDSDWQSPLYRSETTQIRGLKTAIQGGIKVAAKFNRPAGEDDV